MLSWRSATQCNLAGIVPYDHESETARWTRRPDCCDFSMCPKTRWHKLSSNARYCVIGLLPAGGQQRLIYGLVWWLPGSFAAGQGRRRISPMREGSACVERAAARCKAWWHLDLSDLAKYMGVRTRLDWEHRGWDMLTVWECSMPVCSGIRMLYIRATHSHVSL